MRIDVVADGLAEAGAQTVLVRAARAGRDAVDVAAHVLVGGFGPLEHGVEPRPALAVQHEGTLVHGLRAAVLHDLREEVGEPLLVLIGDLRLVDFVLEGDLHALVDVADDLEPLGDDRRIELDLREDRGVGLEVDRRAGAARRAHLLQAALRLALLEGHLPLHAVTPHRGHQRLRERVDDRGAHAVQAARRLVVPLLELAARVEHREDDLHRALPRLRVLVDGHATAIVTDGDRRAVGVERHGDRRRVAIHRLVDRVVENLPDQVVESGRPHAPDVHAGALADGLEALENGDVFRGVRRGHGQVRKG